MVFSFDKYFMHKKWEKTRYPHYYRYYGFHLRILYETIKTIEKNKQYRYMKEYKTSYFSWQFKYFPFFFIA